MPLPPARRVLFWSAGLCPDLASCQRTHHGRCTSGQDQPVGLSAPSVSSPLTAECLFTKVVFAGVSGATGCPHRGLVLGAGFVGREQPGGDGRPRCRSLQGLAGSLAPSLSLPPPGHVLGLQLGPSAFVPPAGKALPVRLQPALDFTVLFHCFFKVRVSTVISLGGSVDFFKISNFYTIFRLLLSVLFLEQNMFDKLFPFWLPEWIKIHAVTFT